MEDHLLNLLRAAQSPSAAPRQAAEQQLRAAQSQPGFPVSLATIASHASVTPDIRQAALLILRTFTDQNWAGGVDDEGLPAIVVDPASREQVRTSILALATGEEENTKVRGSAR